MALTLQSPISELAGVGDSYAKKLDKLGIKTVKDLLFYFPRRWDDFSKITPIRELKTGEQTSVRGTVFDIGSKKSRKGMPITEAIITDETGTVKAVWFNQPYLDKTLKKGDEIFLAGKLEFNYGQVAFNSPTYEKVVTNGVGQNVPVKGSLEGQTSRGPSLLGSLKHVGRIVPVYGETEGLSSKWIRTKIAGLAKLVYGIKDHLPEDVKSKHDLLELSAAVRTMHFPENFGELKKAQKRFLFDNLFCLFISVLSNRKEAQKDRAISVPFDEEVGKKFVASLPFELTDAQRKSAWEILKDIAKTVPMNRLLEGDVGSGKTVVAAMAALMVAKKGYQTAFLVPTEILAVQHLESLKKLLEPFEIKVDLLTSSAKPSERKEILKSLSDGETQVIVGTHSLLSPDVKFWTLAFVIVDEQHRFGVEQRQVLKKTGGATGTMPHFLSMSATPIPRTLAVTIFGDLDISVLTEMPKGRQKVDTHLVPPEKRADGYKFIKEKIAEGQQVFVICPLVSESDKLGVKSATEEAEKLQKETFKKEEVGLLHGRMKKDEKDKVMANFKSGKIHILVSTSVVEVGVDVPNATVMIIEGAERFGLAQLHQFRGRVGRSDKKSYCFLFTDSSGETVQERLSALINSENGFELADRDLEIRGPGELLGVKQHGKIDDTLLAVMKEPEVIGEVKKTTQEFIDKNKLADFPELAKKVEEFDVATTLE